jgi:hypothetical protein
MASRLSRLAPRQAPCIIQVFDLIFERIVTTEDVPCEEGYAQHLRHRCLTEGSKVLRACHPADIVRLIKAISKYECTTVRITSANIDRAVDLYFAKSRRTIVPMGNDQKP